MKIKLLFTIALFFISTAIVAQKNDDLIKGGGKVITSTESSYSNKNLTKVKTSSVVNSKENVIPSVNRTTSSEAGSTAGQLSVSLSGAATYEIPFAVPPGIKDIAPSVGLVYSNQGSNGIAGWGWEIGGVSRISRIPSNKHFDNEIDPVNFNNSDRFALDGQRLILKSGTYGVSGSVYETENHSNIKIVAFGTSPDGANYGPAYFIVYYADGTRGYYGNGGNSRTKLNWSLYDWRDPQNNYILFNYSQSNNSLRINNIQYGGNAGTTSPPNRIQFYYKTRKRTGKAFFQSQSFQRTNILSKVEITASGSLFRKYELTHDETSLGYERITSIKEYNGQNKSFAPISFTYGNTSSTLVKQQSHTLTPGIDYTTTSIVSGDFDGDGYADFISYNKNTRNKININKGVFGSSSFYTSSYNVPNFDDLFSNSMLNHQGKVLSQQGFTFVSEAGGNVKFESYYSGTVGLYYHYTKNWSSPTYTYDNYCGNTITKKIPKEYVSGDFNGDGLTDVIAITKPYTVRNCNTVSNCGGGGGGLDEIIDEDTDPIGGGGGLDEIIDEDTDPIGGGGSGSCCQCNSYTINSASATFIDLDRNRTSNYVKSLGNLQSTLTGNYRINTADFNGDGKTDIFLFTNGKLLIYSLNSSENLTLLYTLNDSYIKTDQPILIGDYNGDGKADFITPSANNSTVWRFFYSLGQTTTGSNQDIGIGYVKNYNSQATYIGGYYVTSAYREYNYTPIDVNKDGKTDIIRHYVATTNHPIVAGGINNPTASNEAVSIYENKFASGSANPTFELTAEIIDQNNGITKYGVPLFIESKVGNNLLEYAYVDGNKVYPYEFTKNHKEDVTLYSVYNNGVTDQIEYETLGYYNSNQPYNNDPAYTSDFNEVYPYVNVNHSETAQIVRKITETGAGITREQKFKYEGAVAHASLGFLGFKKTMRTGWYGDDVSEIWNISKHNPQLRGAVTENWLANTYWNYETSYVNKTTYTYQTEITSQNVFKNFPTRIFKQNALMGISSTEDYIYDSYGNITRKTHSFQGGNNQIDYTYSNSISSNNSTYHVGRITKIIESNLLVGNNFTTETQYSYSNNLVNQEKVKGIGTDWNTESYQYDVFGNITQKTLSSSGVSSRIESYTYDSSGRFLTESTGVEGLKTKYTYDVLGSLKTTKNPYNQVVTNNYDGWNRLISEIDFLGKVRTISFTAMPDGGFEKHTNFPEGRDERITYNTYGWVIKDKVLGLNNQWTSKSYEYDAIGRRLKESEPYFSSPSQWNTFAYDENGRIVSQTSYTGRVVTSTYSGTSVSVDDGVKTITTTKDGADNTIRVQDPGGTIDYQYHGNGVMKSASYGSHIVSIQIDGWGRKVSMNDPSAGTFTYSYNNFGEMLQENSPKGVTKYLYDSVGKLIRKELEGINTGMLINYSYDSTTKLLSSVQASNNQANNESFSYYYYYDSYKRLNRVTENNAKASFEKKLTRDGFGRIITEEYTSTNLSNGYSSNVKINNTYDTYSGILERIVNADNLQTLWRLNSVDHRENATSMTLGNGYNKGRFYDQYGYLTSIADQKKQITQIGVPPTALVALKVNYSFDTHRGNLLSRNNVGLNWQENFTFDHMDRLTDVSGSVNDSKKYDTRGRITDNTELGQYTYQSSNAYRVADITLNGNGTNYYSNHDLQKVSFNAFKKPVEIIEEGHGRVNIVYNPLLQRSHAYFGNESTDINTRKFHKHYSAISPVEITEDKESGSTKIVTYIGGDEYAASVVHVKQSPGSDVGALDEFYYLHRDYLGSILAISDSNADIIEERQFGAWGKVDKFIDAQNNTEFNHTSIINRGFTGHEHFFGVSLVHMNGRLYDAKLGRFLSPDDFIQEPFNTQSFNRYGYVWNNPLKFNDPSGEFIFTALIIGAVVGAYFGGVQANKSWNPLKWDWKSSSTWGGILGGAVVGAASVVVGAAAAAAVAPALASAGITGGILGYGITGAVGGAAGGAFSGAIMSGLPGGDGDWIGGAWKGAVSGMVTGFLISGTIGAFKTPPGHNIWTGNKLKPKIVILKPDAKTASTLDPKGIKTIEVEVKSNIVSKSPAGNQTASSKPLNINKTSSSGIDGKVKTNLLTQGSKPRPFKSGELAIEHFGKHGRDIMKLTGRSTYDIRQYLSEANHIIKNGTFIPERNAYIKFMGSYGGTTKFGFVGLDRVTGQITTYHIKGIGWLEKFAPSLGFSR